MVLKRVFLFCLFVFFSSAGARWADPKEAAVSFELWRTVYKVAADGTFIKDVEFKAKILKESAISGFGSYRLTYNGHSEKLDILSAKVISKKKEFPVSPRHIEDKPLASAPNGFDQHRQILITFPHIQVGSSIYLRYRHHFKITAFKNFFSFSADFGYYLTKNMTYHIESAQPLFYKIHNPGEALKISYHKNRKKKYIFKIGLRRPLFKRIVDEKAVFTDRNNRPWIELATTKNWSKMVEHLVPQYEQIIKAPLPKLHSDILKEAQKIKTDSKDQIEFILTKLIERIRYFRDWRSVNGGHVPRSLPVIAQTGFGDCKDMSVSLAALLRLLGFTAHVGFIQRGFLHHLKNDFKLPSGAAFNHAIVRAEKNGKVFWLDPTNQVSYTGLFGDLADRPILVLKPSGPELDRTPKLNSLESEFRVNRVFKMLPKKQVHIAGSIHFKGRSAIGWTAGSLYKSKKSLDHDFLRFLGGDTSALKEWKVTGYDLNSRIVRDFSVQISYILDKNGSSFGFRTQLGPAFLFPKWIGSDMFDIRIQDRITDLFLGQPRRAVFVSTMKNIEPVGNTNFNCVSKSPWADFYRQVESTKPLTIKEIYVIKTPQLSAKELKSRQFLKFQKNVQSCFERFLMIYKTR